MNSTINTGTKIPEVFDAAPPDLRRQDMADGYMGGMGNPDVLKLAIIARIPDLDAPATPRPKHKRSSRSGKTKPIPVARRLLSAGLSMKVLIGLGLLLMLGAIAPYVVIQVTNNFRSKSDNTFGQAWQPSPPAPTADLAPVWTPQTIASESSAKPAPEVAGHTAPGFEQLVTSIKPASEEPSAQDMSSADNRNGIIASSQLGKPIVGTAAVAHSSTWPRPEDQADFSPWPNPAYPILARTETGNNVNMSAGASPLPARTTSAGVVANRSMAIDGTSPFTADVRNAPIPAEDVRVLAAPPLKASVAAQPSLETEAGRARFEGRTDTSSDRNTYERSRPSIH